MIKVSEEDDYIYGQCGGCEDFYPLREILAEAKGDPWQLMQLTKNDTYKSMFGDMAAVVATKDYGLYHIERSPHSDATIESNPDTRPRLAAFPVTDDDLPIYDGSGKYHVQGALAGVKKLTPKVVEAAIKRCYSTNMTIGGKIRTVKIKRNHR